MRRRRRRRRKGRRKGGRRGGGAWCHVRGTFEEVSKGAWRKEGSEMSSKQHSVSNWLSCWKPASKLFGPPPPNMSSLWHIWHSLPIFFCCCCFLNFKHKSSANVGSLCVGIFFFLFTDGPLPLLHHLDPEGDAAQELVPFVVVAQVGALYPALHRQLLVVVLLGEQQLHSHQGLHVILLQSCKGDGRLSITRPCEDIRGHHLTGGGVLTWALLP